MPSGWKTKNRGKLIAGNFQITISKQHENSDEYCYERYGREPMGEHPADRLENDPNQENDQPCNP